MRRNLDAGLRMSALLDIEHKTPCISDEVSPPCSTTNFFDATSILNNNVYYPSLQTFTELQMHSNSSLTTLAAEIA
jgi:hypothetical protein